MPNVVHFYVILYFCIVLIPGSFLGVVRGVDSQSAAVDNFPSSQRSGP